MRLYVECMKFEINNPNQRTISSKQFPALHQDEFCSQQLNNQATHHVKQPWSMKVDYIHINHTITTDYIMVVSTSSVFLSTHFLHRFGLDRGQPMKMSGSFQWAIEYLGDAHLLVSFTHITLYVFVLFSCCFQISR